MNPVGAIQLTSLGSRPDFLRTYDLTCYRPGCLQAPLAPGRAHEASASFPRKRTSPSSSSRARVSRTGDNLGLTTSFVASARYTPPRADQAEARLAARLRTDLDRQSGIRGAGRLRGGATRRAAPDQNICRLTCSPRITRMGHVGALPPLP